MRCKLHDCAHSISNFSVNPDPTPILGRAYTIKGRTLTLSFEQTALRYTKPFTSKWLLAILVAAYIIALSFLVRAQYYLVPSDAWLGCTSTYWLADDQCGLNGDECTYVSTAVHI